jgi:hypothetical protein
MATPAQRRIGIAAAVLVVAAIAGYWWFSPYLAIRAMQQAASRGDADAFSEHVDYPRLRENLKREMAQQVNGFLGGFAARGDDLGRAGAALGALLGVGIAERLVDALVQPEVVMRVMEEGKLLPPAGAGNPAPASSAPPPRNGGSGGGDKLHWSEERQGADRYIAHAWRGNAAQRVSVVLERRGFADWKLVEIRLPPP